MSRTRRRDFGTRYADDGSTEAFTDNPDVGDIGTSATAGSHAIEDPAFSSRSSKLVTEMVKQVVTLTTASIVVLATFLDRTSKTAAAESWLPGAIYCFIVCLALSITYWAVNLLTTRQEQSQFSTLLGRVLAVLSGFAFLCGFGCLGEFTLRSVTMKATVESTGTPLVTSFRPMKTRNNYSGWVGMHFTVGSTALTVSALGRYCLDGNSETHVIKLVQASDGSDVPGASVSISMDSGSCGRFVYGQLQSVVMLPPHTTYYLISEETQNGDKFYDSGPVTASNLVSIDGPVYWNGSSWYLAAGLSKTSFVPVNLLYTSRSTEGPGVEDQLHSSPPKSTESNPTTTR